MIAALAAKDLISTSGVHLNHGWAAPMLANRRFGAADIVLRVSDHARMVFEMDRVPAQPVKDPPNLVQSGVFPWIVY